MVFYMHTRRCISIINSKARGQYKYKKQTISSTISISVACDFEKRHEERKEALRVLALQKNAAYQNHEKKNILYDVTLRENLMIPDMLVAIVIAQ